MSDDLVFPILIAIWLTLILTTCYNSATSTQKPRDVALAACIKDPKVLPICDELLKTLTKE